MYEIVTQGGGEILWKCLNAIAMLSKGGIFGTFIFIFLYIAVICYSYMVAVNQDIVGVSKKLAVSLVIVAVMLAPSVRVLVTDKVTYFRKPVDNVPYLLALSAYVASNVGQAMAYEYDLSFQEPGFSSYTETGMNMYSSIITKISEARLPSTSQSADMKNFVSQCLIYDLALGKYPLEELMNTPDPLKFITEHTSSQRGIILAQEGKKQLIPCNRALQKLMTGKKDYLAEYVMKAAAELFPGFKGRPEDLGRMLALSIGDAYSYLAQEGAKAEEILRINMLRNLIRDWQGDHDPAMAYALAHAEQNQGFSFKIMGKMAGNFLPILKIIIEVLIIGIFPIVAVLSIMPGGINILKKYLFMFFWVELWPVLFTILNMVFVTYAKYRSGAVTEGGLSLGNISALAEVNDNISSFAGYAMGLIPWLSFMVVQGAASIGQLATSMIGATQSSVGSAAAEAATGSYRLNTVDVDSHNRHNDNGFKYDNNISYAKGKESWQKPGGEIEYTMPDGSSVLDRRPAMSDLGATFNTSEGLSSGISQMAERSRREGISHMQSSQENLASALNDFQAIGDNYRKDKNLSNGFTHGESVLTDSGLAKVTAASKELSDALNIDLQTANKLLLNGNLGVSGGKGAGASIGGSAGFGFDENTQNNHQQRVAESISKKYDIQETLKKAEIEGKEGRYTMSDASGNQYDSGIRVHLDKGFSDQKLAQASFAKEEAFRETAQIVSNSGVETTQNLGQQVYEWGREKYGSDFNSMLSNPNAMAQIRKEFIASHKPQLEQQFTGSGIHKSPEQLESQYRDDVKAVKEASNPEAEYNKNKESIINKAGEMNLGKEVESDLPASFDQAKQNFDGKLKAEQNKINVKQAKMEANYAEFSKRNKVNDWSTGFKDWFFERKPIDKPTGKLDDE
jgi:conjugal transfer mating pair stabilization protein TraG